MKFKIPTMKLSEISKKSGVPHVLVKAVFIAVGDKKVSKVEVVRLSGVPEESVKKIKEVSGNLFLPIQNFFVLSDEGKKFLSQLSLEKNGLTMDEWEQIKSIYERYQSQRPKPETGII